MKDGYAPGEREPEDSIRVLMTHIGFVAIEVRIPIFNEQLINIMSYTIQDNPLGRKVDHKDHSYLLSPMPQSNPLK